MKKLEIVVRSEKLDDVKSILDECESTGAMVSNIMGYGNQKGYKKHRYPISFLFLNWQAVAFVHCLFFIVQLCLPVSSADFPGSSLYTT